MPLFWVSFKSLFDLKNLSNIYFGDLDGELESL